MEHNYITSAINVMDATLLPIINIMLGYTIKIMSTQPDFIVDKAQKLIIGAGAFSGFIAGIRLGKPQKNS